MSENQTGRQQKRRPDLDTVYSINADGSRNFLHPADVRGRWQVLKNLTWMVLILVYVALPWLQLHGRSAINIDLPGRNAYLFGLTFTNQDFYLMFFVVTGIGFGLFVATALWGRIWCGFACPQTVFLEGVFRKLERWIEGPRITRIRRNQGPNTFDKTWRKGLKHFFLLGGSYVIAHVFLSYFIPTHELMEIIQSSPKDHPSAFGWSMFFMLLMYFDYAWFREQTCIVICPYGRLQSSLIDEDTIIIGYDEIRGEPRSKGVEEGGDCIDCFRCVEVCPTGIDIRGGLQLECIGCTNCIDACDEIMDKVGKPRGLVRYDSQWSLDGHKRRPLLRPRVFVYAVLGLIGLGVASMSVGSRMNFHANALRAKGLPFSIEDGRIRNLYTIRVQNKSDRASTYHIRLEDQVDGIEMIMPQPDLHLDSLEDGRSPVFFYLDRDSYTEPFILTLSVMDSLSGVVTNVKVTFRGP
jgi:cytochrome c oxidase accessory protein FixG